MKSRIASILAMVLVMGFATAGFSAATCPKTAKDTKAACCKKMSTSAKKGTCPMAGMKTKSSPKGVCPVAGMHGKTSPKAVKGSCPRKIK